MINNEKFDLAVLLLISLLLSIYLFFQTYIISMDGAFQYIPMAKDFASGLFREALSHNQQPLYSFLLPLFPDGYPILSWQGNWYPPFLDSDNLPGLFLGKTNIRSEDCLSFRSILDHSPLYSEIFSRCSQRIYLSLLSCYGHLVCLEDDPK